MPHLISIFTLLAKSLGKIEIKFLGDLMQVTAAQAKNSFGALCDHAKIEPVFVEKDGRIDTVIVSAKQFSELQAAHRVQPLSERKAHFEQSHSAWLAEQNQRFETHGLWCDDMRVW